MCQAATSCLTTRSGKTPLPASRTATPCWLAACAETLLDQAQRLAGPSTVNLKTEVHWHDAFPAVVNDEEATAIAPLAAE